MPSQGYNTPALVVEFGAGEPITDLDFCRVEDGVYSEMLSSATGIAAKAAYVSGFGFSIPDGATITGFQVYTVAGEFYDSSPFVEIHFRLSKDGSNFSSSRELPLIYEAQPYTVGGTSDLWDLSWTPAEVNASSFGVLATPWQDIDAVQWSVNIDTIQVMVTYTGGGGPSGMKTTVAGRRTPILVKPI